VINYHKKQLNKATDVKSLMMGHRPVDLNDTSLEDKWMYDKLPERY